MNRQSRSNGVTNPAYNDSKSHLDSFDPVKIVVRGEDGSSSIDSTRKWTQWRQFKEMFLLPLMLFIAMVLGIGIGFGIRKADPSFIKDDRRIMFLNYPGELLMRMLKMCIIPLIVSSLIAGMASLPAKAAGKLGLKTVCYYLSTTFLAVLLGILLVCTIRPGDRNSVITDAANRDKLVDPIDALLDLIRNVFPPNLIEACFKQTSTEYSSMMVMENVTTFNATAFNGTGFNETVEVPKEVVTGFKVTTGGGSNVLGLVVFSIVFGLMVGRMGQPGRILLLFFDAVQQVIIKIVRLIIWYSPVGVMFLLAARIVGMDDPGVRFKQLAWYMMTVILGLVLHGLVVLPTIHLIIGRKNPFKLMVHMSQALLTALGTASSSATLPITMKNLEERAKVNPRISGFMVPVGATINMDGTALYEAVASIFIAQYNNISLNAGQVITVSITSTAAAIGAAGVPEAGLVTMLIVLTAVGLPTEDVGLIYAVDWFLDRLRTCVNVWGDSIGASLIDATSQDDLLELEETEQREKDRYNGYAGYSHYLHDNSMTSVSHL